MFDQLSGYYGLAMLTDKIKHHAIKQVKYIKNDGYLTEYISVLSKQNRLKL